MLAEARSGILLYGIVPPRRNVPPEKVKEIAEVTLTRLAGLDLDGLILYDIDDESDRNPDERPFPYLPTLDPADFLRDHLGGWDRPADPNDPQNNAKNRRVEIKVYPLEAVTPK